MWILIHTHYNTTNGIKEEREWEGERKREEIHIQNGIRLLLLLYLICPLKNRFYWESEKYKEKRTNSSTHMSMLCQYYRSFQMEFMFCVNILCSTKLWFCKYFYCHFDYSLLWMMRVSLQLEQLEHFFLSIKKRTYKDRRQSDREGVRWKHLTFLCI